MPLPKTKSNFDAAKLVKIETSLEVSNFERVDVSSAAAQADNIMSQTGFKPDRWKAYVDFDIVHCCPAIIGPTQEGIVSTYLPGIVAASHGSLLHQQVNLNHLLKAYSSKEDGDNVPKDRIVGCVVATWFPPKPIEGWKIGDDPKTAPSIRARAVIFKLADGVNRIIGDHQTSRKKQSVSIESITSIGNLGVYLPSRGVDKIQRLDEVDDPAILSALSFDPLKFGKVNGEQGVFVWGMTDPVEFRGVGITPRPAESEAKIIAFDASKIRTEQTPDGGTLIAMAANQVDLELEGREVRFKSTGRVGKIVKVFNDGIAKLPGMGWSMEATIENPVLQIVLPGTSSRPAGVNVLLRMNELADRIVD